MRARARGRDQAAGRAGRGEILETARRLATEAAETGVARVLEEAWTTFAEAEPGRHAAAALALDGSRPARPCLAHRGCSHGRARYDAEVFGTDRDGPDDVDVRIRATGVAGPARKSIVCVVRFGFGPAMVYDHGLFLDGFACLRGAGLTVHGDLGANGDIEGAGIRVNGDLRAARNPALGSLGTISGEIRSDPLDVYRARCGGRARPSNPTADLDALEAATEGVSEPYVYPVGYSGRPHREPGGRPLSMPYLGDLDRYVALAEDRGGTLMAGHTILTAGGRYEGTLLLEGTAESPIRIRGPVVVDGDVVLRGVVAGQGTIYAARNVHVVGDLTYETAPTWPKPSAWPGVDDSANRSADALGLVARGNVVLGNVARRGFARAVGRHARPPHTLPQRVDPEHDDLGYATGRDERGPVFHGDYTGFDGGRRTDGSPRRYYQPTIGDAELHAVAGGPVRQIDAVLHADHAVIGELGPACIHGAVVARDEAIVFDGSLTIAHDVRLHSGAFRELDIHLPRGPRKRLLMWQESGEEIVAGQKAS